MKTILTLIFALFIGLSAQANNGSKDVKVEAITKTITTSTANENKVARLYMYKNANIKKELSFSTKLNKAKLA